MDETSRSRIRIHDWAEQWKLVATDYDFPKCTVIRNPSIPNVSIVVTYNRIGSIRQAYRKYDNKGSSRNDITGGIQSVIQEMKQFRSREQK